MQEFKPADWTLKCTPYQVSESGKLTLNEKKQYLKLDWNESSYPPSPVVKARLVEVIKDGVLNFYPDTTASELRNKLAHYIGIDESYIQVFNGSDAALQAMCLVYLNSNDNVLVREPTYTQIYPFISNVEANALRFTGDTPFSLALDKYHQHLSGNKIRMVYIPNPNNPTGVIYGEAIIREFLERYPETLFVIDEAYFEYAGQTVVKLVRDFCNIAVTRTFSKAFGLAGVRIGYLLSQPQMIANLNKIYNRKDVNVLAQIAASAALDDIPYMEAHVKEVKKAREWLVNKLINLGIETYTTPANFILIKVPEVQQVILGLKKNKILVRDRSSLPQLDGYMRVTIGLSNQMEHFWETFSRVVSTVR